MKIFLQFCKFPIPWISWFNHQKYFFSLNIRTCAVLKNSIHSPSPARMSKICLLTIVIIITSSMNFNNTNFPQLWRIFPRDEIFYYITIFDPKQLSIMWCTLRLRYGCIIIDGSSSWELKKQWIIATLNYIFHYETEKGLKMSLNYFKTQKKWRQ